MMILNCSCFLYSSVFCKTEDWGNRLIRFDTYAVCLRTLQLSTDAVEKAKQRPTANCLAEPF